MAVKRTKRTKKKATKKRAAKTVNSPAFDIAKVDENLSDPEQERFLSDLEAGLYINEHELEHACQHHPERFYTVSKHIVLQTSRRDAAKQFLQETEARIDHAIRLAASKSGEKTTEKEIEASKLRHPDVINAKKQLLKINHSVDQFAALKEAYHQRGYVLKSMVELFISNYYSEISSTTNNDDIKNNDAAITKKKIKKKRYRKA